MSLAIDVDRVDRVLLPDGWHDVLDRSFKVDTYEFKRRGDLVHYGGQDGVCAAGYSFQSPDGYLHGPLSAIQAVSLTTQRR